MANGKTIKNFLVGLGFDYDKSGADQIDSSIDSIKGKALQLGAVVTGAFGLKEMTFGFAEANDSLGKFSEVLGVDADAVAALSRVMEHSGGTAEGFIGQLRNLESMRAGLQVGDAGWLATAGAAGIDTESIVQAGNATEAYLELADQFRDMSRQERINAAQALGLDDAAIRMLSTGRDAIVAAMKAEQDMRPVTEEMTKAAAEFNDETQDLLTNVGGIADKISMRLVPAINNVVSGMNDWIGANRELIDENLDDALENVGAGALGLAVGKVAGPVAGAAVAGAGVAWDWTAKDVEELTGVRLPDWVFTPIADMIPESTGPGTLRGMPAEGMAPLRVEANLHLDGRVIEQKVIEVTDRQYSDAADEIETNIEG